ncbi:MAG TPA: hypothetical protein VF025_09470 [Gaiellaceae bacterium]
MNRGVGAVRLSGQEVTMDATSRAIPGSRTAQGAETESEFWWIFFRRGVLWLLFALLVFQFDSRTVHAISLLLGFTCFGGAALELLPFRPRTAGGASGALPLPSASACSLVARRGVDPVAVAAMTGHGVAVWASQHARSFGKPQREEARQRLLEQGFGADIALTQDERHPDDSESAGAGDPELQAVCGVERAGIEPVTSGLQSLVDGRAWRILPALEGAESPSQSGLAAQPTVPLSRNGRACLLDDVASRWHRAFRPSGGRLEIPIRARPADLPPPRAPLILRNRFGPAGSPVDELADKDTPVPDAAATSWLTGRDSKSSVARLECHGQRGEPEVPLVGWTESCWLKARRVVR